MEYDSREVLSHYRVSTKDSEGEVLKLKCPFHDDHNPSSEINLARNSFRCWVCNKSGSTLTYIAGLYKKTVIEIYREVGKLVGVSSYHLVEDIANVKKWHTAIWEHPDLLKELYRRGLTDREIEYYYLGAVKPGEVTEPAEIRIPIPNCAGDIIAVKSYRPGAESGKYIWRQSPSNKRNKKDLTHLLFPEEQLVYSKVLICGGEIKALAASRILNPHEIGAISGTGAENVAFTPGQLVNFKNKVVYVCYDIDETGREYSLKLCRNLKNYTEDIYLVELPLDPENYPTGDINDFIHTEGDLHQLLLDTPKWVYAPPVFDTLDQLTPTENTTLSKAVMASMAKKKVCVETIVSSMDTQSYSLPKDIELHCDRNHNYCSICLIHEEFSTEKATVSLSEERVELMELASNELAKQERILKKAFGIPQRCTAVVFSALNYHHVEDVRISQSLDITSRANERSMQAAFCVGEDVRIELNEKYKMTGRMHPHPKTQQATLLITELETTQDALTMYEPTDLESLEIFQPTVWTMSSLKTKLDEIYDDLSHNVTHIYGRQDLHLMYDLAYHSVLFLSEHIANTKKGWVDVLIIGDSAQGKSACANALVDHYGLGERVVCKGATVAGLLGGVQQHGTKWFATWGKIPTHDRRIVILDELKGMPELVIAGLTDMRSQGIAELTKITKRRTNARTRLIWISNPRSDRVVREYNTGIDIVTELIGSPEDVRRFDAVMILAQKEVSEEFINKDSQRIVPHKYNSQVCRDLILFGWTVPNVEFEDPTKLYKSTVKLTSEFVENVPIVDANTMKQKLARLATALAVRTFSIKDKETVYVRNCHVDYIVSYLNHLYSSDVFGYLEYSKKKKAAERIVDPDKVKIRILNDTSHPKEFIREMLLTDEFDATTFQDILGWPQQEARNLLAFFNRHRCLKKSKRMYRKSPAFHRLLEELEQELDDDDTKGRPDYIPEEF